MEKGRKGGEGRENGPFWSIPACTVIYSVDARANPEDAVSLCVIRTQRTTTKSATTGQREPRCTPVAVQPQPDTPLSWRNVNCSILKVNSKP